MSLPDRPTRFVVIPPVDRDLRPTVSVIQFLNPQPRRAAPAKKAAASAAHGRPMPVAAPKLAGLHIVKRSPPDGAVLVQGANSVTEVRARAPEGAKVFVEQWYRLDRSARPWMKQGAELRKPRVTAATAATWTITVRLDDADQRPLKDAVVTVFTNEEKGIGLEATTDRYGRAKFELSKNAKVLDAVYVEPLHSGWPVAIRSVDIGLHGMLIKVVPLDLEVADVRGQIYAKPTASSGKGVVVGIIDTGVGSHAALKVGGGMNVTGEAKTRYTDEDGHGTHVAGVIASSASGWRRGEACKVELRAYRIFKTGEDYASTFDIATAIKQAAADGCDLINMSIGGAEDGTVKDAIELAWNAGSVCIAATGNDGTDQVDYPARYAHCLAVSAIGIEASWPAGAYLDWTLSAVKGKTIADQPTFFASFSNRGAQVALTAPGVAVVSTIFDNRWGVMSGTSMATPVATGVIARRLAESPVLKMARDANRAEAIAKLALGHAEDLNFTANRQGKGLAR